MELLLCTQPDLRREAERFVLTLGAKPNTILPRQRLPALETATQCLFYLKGDESASKLADRLKQLRRKAKLRKVVLYAGAASPGVAAEWGRLVERLLAKRAAICFAPPEVAKALNVRLSAAGVAVEQAPTTGSQVAQLREKLDLTQEQMAQAVGVTGRTIQNWESQGPSAQAERRLRDLVELWETLHRYFRPEDIPTWLNAENDAFGAPPLKLVVAGRARDVLIEFRRTQSGQPM